MAQSQPTWSNYLFSVCHYPSIRHYVDAFLCKVVAKDDIGISGIIRRIRLIGLFFEGTIVFDLLRDRLINDLVKAEIRATDVVDRQRVGTLVELEAKAHRAPHVIGGDVTAHLLFRAVDAYLQVAFLADVHVA